MHSKMRKSSHRENPFLMDLARPWVRGAFKKNLTQQPHAAAARSSRKKQQHATAARIRYKGYLLHVLRVARPLATVSSPAAKPANRIAGLAGRLGWRGTDI